MAPKGQGSAGDRSPALSFSRHTTPHPTPLPSPVPVVSDSHFLWFLCPFEAGCRQVQDLEISSVEVDPCGDAQAAAEGAVLGLYEYDDMKQKKKVVVSAKLHGRCGNEAKIRVAFPGVPAGGPSGASRLPFSVGHCCVACARPPPSLQPFQEYGTSPHVLLLAFVMCMSPVMPWAPPCLLVARRQHQIGSPKRHGSR